MSTSKLFIFLIFVNNSCSETSVHNSVYLELLRIEIFAEEKKSVAKYNAAGEIQ
jgi:hypothetical protein